MPEVWRASLGTLDPWVSFKFNILHEKAYFFLKIWGWFSGCPSLGDPSSRAKHLIGSCACLGKWQYPEKKLKNKMNVYLRTTITGLEGCKAHLRLFTGSFFRQSLGQPEKERSFNWPSHPKERRGVVWFLLRCRRFLRCACCEIRHSRGTLSSSSNGRGQPERKGRHRQVRSGSDLVTTGVHVSDNAPLPYCQYLRCQWCPPLLGNLSWCKCSPGWAWSRASFSACPKKRN